MKQTPLTQTHIALGAKMVDFAGYSMPVSYGGIKEEHAYVRKNVGVFDVSHMGEFMLHGEKALDLVQKISSNDAAKLVDGQAQYCCMPNENGGIVDDMLIYRINQNEWMLVVNASNMQKDWNWIQSQNDMGVEMHDVSDDTCLLAVQGPNAAKALQPLTETKLDEISYYHFAQTNFAGIDNVLISATGYTGAGGFEIYAPKGNAKLIWDSIFEAGKSIDIQPIGLGARDTLRLEMGFCLYGNDIDDTTNPIEAGLSWITKFTKDFTAKDIIEKVKADGATRRLVGFEMVDKGIPRQGYTIADADGNEIGTVTSGTMSPSLEKAIGLGYVQNDFRKSDSEIYIQVRNKSLKAKVVKLPFYKG